MAKTGNSTSRKRCYLRVGMSYASSSMEPLSSSRRNPALDAWRGIAILIVLIDHLQTPLFGRYLLPSSDIGQHGVTIFFVLSGFLITTKLLEGPINLKNFYVRRFFKLLPVAWTYLLFTWLIGLMLGPAWGTWRDIVSCLLFFRNYVMVKDHGFATYHFWSLSIEEQFYLAWPALLLLLRPRKATWFVMAGALACAGYRLMNWGYYSQWGPDFRTEARADALLVGCLLALVLRNTSSELVARVSKAGALPSLVVFCSCIGPFRPLPPLVECLAIAVLIAASVLHPHSVFSRLLSLRPLAWLGTVSYSVYVWHFGFVVLSRPGASAFVMIVLISSFALASYYWIERPCTRFGHRITARPGAETRTNSTEPVLDSAGISG